MKKKHGNFLILTLVFAVLFALVALLVKFGIFLQIDGLINLFFVSNQSAVWTSVFSFISFLASILFVPFLLLAILIFFYVKKEYRKGLFLLFNFVIGAGLGFIIKELVGRIRPINLIEKDFSFPSLHVVSAVAVYGSLAYLLWEKNRKISWVLIVFCLIEGFSRLYLNVHWFSDVLAGYLLGLFTMGVCAWLLFHHKY